MFCQKCGAPMNADARFCPKCGIPTDIKEISPEIPTVSTPIEPKKKRRKVGCLIAAILFAITGTLIAVISQMGQTQPDSSSVSLPVNSTSAVPEVDILQDVTETSLSQLAEIKEILRRCGVAVISVKYDDLLDGFIENDEVLDVIGYRIESREAKNIILYLNTDKTVFAVRYADDNMYKDGEFIKTLTQIINRPDLEIIGDITDSNDGFALYLEGTIRNNASKTYSYVQVSFGIYDNAGNKTGTAMANVNNLGAGETWKFKAICLTPPTNGGNYKLDEITGF